MKVLRSKSLMVLIAVIMLVVASVAACAKEAVPPTEPTEPAVEPIVMAAPVSLGTAGKHGFMAAELAVEEINKAGGVLLEGVKRPLKIVTTDTRDLEPGIPIHDVILAYEDLISREKPDVFVAGPTRSEAVLAVMENLAEDKIVHIFNGAVSPAIQATIAEDYDKYKYFFKISPNAIDMGMLYAKSMDFIKSNFGLDKVFFMTEDVMSMRALEGFMSGYCEKTGWEVMGSLQTPLGMTDYSPSLIKIRNSGAEVIFYSYSSEAAAMARQFEAMDFPALMIGVCDPLGIPGAWEATEGAVQGMVGIALGAGHMPVKQIPKSVEFYDNYAEKHGEPVGLTLGCAQAYDAVYVMVDAIERAGSLASDKLITALEATDYPGVMGSIKFDPEDHAAIYGFDPAEGAIQVLFQWVDGNRVPVFPESVAEAEIQLP